MPARLGKLATLFETIIFTYYGYRPEDVILESDSEQQEGSDEFIEVKRGSVSIDDYILYAAAQKKGSDRAPLMSYLGYGIQLIRTTLENPKPLDENSCQELKNQLIQLLVDLQSVSVGSKSAHIAVNYNGTQVMIKGCCGCTSGNLLQNVLFSTIKSVDDEMKAYIVDIVNAHQSPLLKQENQRLAQQVSEQCKASHDLKEKHRMELETMKNMKSERRSIRPLPDAPPQNQTTKQVKFSFFSREVDEQYAGRDTSVDLNDYYNL